MFNLSTKIKDQLSVKKEATPWKLQFVRNSSDILKLLLQSKAEGILLGLYSPILGEGMFLTKVENIHLESTHNDKIVVLNRYDMSGHILSTTRVALSEIRILCPFNEFYKNPVLSLNSAVYQ